MHTFLVEIGTEELPPKSLRALAESFAKNFEVELNNHHLKFNSVRWFASPRRLALMVNQLATSQPDTNVTKRGPAISQAFDANGNPTPAAVGWANSCNITVEQAERIKTDKGEWLSFTQKQKGQSVNTLLPALVNAALNKLPIPKPMRWGDKDTQFIRPVHTVTMLYDDTLIEGTVLGIPSDRRILGHRFMGEQTLTISNANDYLSLLKTKGYVLADYDARKTLIRQGIESAAKKLNGKADLSESLLEEVTSLVEWPVVLTAKFEERFLDVPSEALVHTMKSDQKYFPVYDQDNKLLPHFIFVTNIESRDPNQIILGNEKVVRPRLSDAEFFFKTDLKTPLDAKLSRLETVLFQQQLGSLRDKTDRIQVLSGSIAKQLGADVDLATRAGLLSKCDLMTNMVFEFPETQGVMGMYYARHSGEHNDVAIALNEHYLPRFSGDRLPESLISCAVAIADKMDTLTGIFGINLPPKGDKDPFALRRAALGVLRIIVEKALPLDLAILAQEAVNLYGDKLTNKNTVNDVVDFMLARFKAWYQEAGYNTDIIQSVLLRRPTKPLDFDLRIKAVAHFSQLDAAATLAAANKRVSNILAKVTDVIPTQINESLLKEPAEIALANVIRTLQTEVTPLFEQNAYQQALVKLATLREPIDNFFDNVMVMADDAALKNNRLCLLAALRELFLHVADISVLQL